MCLLVTHRAQRTTKEAADSLASQLLADEPERVDPSNGGAGGGGLLEAPASADSRYNSVVKKLLVNTETYEIREKCLKWKWICRLDDKVVRPPCCYIVRLAIDDVMISRWPWPKRQRGRVTDGAGSSVAAE